MRYCTDWGIQFLAFNYDKYYTFCGTKVHISVRILFKTFVYASSPKTRLKATLGKGLQERKHINAKTQLSLR